MKGLHEVMPSGLALSPHGRPKEDGRNPPKNVVNLGMVYSEGFTTLYCVYIYILHGLFKFMIIGFTVLCIYIYPQMVYFNGVSNPSICAGQTSKKTCLPRPSSKPSCRAARAARLALSEIAGIH